MPDNDRSICGGEQTAVHYFVLMPITYTVASSSLNILIELCREKQQKRTEPELEPQVVPSRTTAGWYVSRTMVSSDTGESGSHGILVVG